MKLFKFIGKSFVSFLIKWHFVSLLLPIYCRSIRQVLPDGTRVGFVRKRARDKYVILALKHDMYRNDLEVLASSPDFYILEIFRLQYLIASTFYPSVKVQECVFFNPSEGSNIDIGRKRCRSFLYKFLASFYKRVPVDCVVSANDRNRGDFDWGVVSQKLNVPYIIMFREGLMMTKYSHDLVIERVRSKGKFQGAHFIARNEALKNAYLEAGFVESDRISVCGTLRMDSLLTKINKNENYGNRKMVVYFHFSHRHACFGDKEGNYKLFRDANLVLAKLALSLPNVDFVVKPKIQVKGALWNEPIFRQVFSKEGIDIDKIANFNIKPLADVHELILRADVVCGGMNSTVVLESAVAGKPVVLPCFKSYRESVEFDRFTYHKYLHLFDIADDAEDFRQRILSRLDNPDIAPDIQKERERLFERYVSPLAANAAENYRKIFVRIITEYRHKRSLSS